MHRLFLAVACGGYSLVAVHELLTAAASLVAKHGLCGAWTLVGVAHGLWWVWRTDFGECGARILVGVVHRLWWCGAWTSVVVAHGLSSCRTYAQLLCGMWNLPRPGTEPVYALC